MSTVVWIQCAVIVLLVLANGHCVQRIALLERANSSGALQATVAPAEVSALLKSGSGRILSVTIGCASCMDLLHAMAIGDSQEPVDVVLADGVVDPVSAAAIQARGVPVHSDMSEQIARMGVRIFPYVTTVSDGLVVHGAPAKQKARSR